MSVRLWSATLERESRRLDLSGFRAGFVAMTGLVLFQCGEFGPDRAREFLFDGLTQLSWWLCAGLGVYLPGDAVDLRTSGMLALLRLTGVSSQQWWLVRWLQMWTAFASVWCVRLPFLCLAFTFGELTLTAILLQEAVFLFVFVVLGSVGLFLAIDAETRQVVVQVTPVTLVLLEFLFVLPLGVTFVMRGLLDWHSPGWVTAGCEAIAQLGMAPYLMVPGHVLTPLPFVTYSLVVLFANRHVRRQGFHAVDVHPETKRIEATTSQSRLSRRVWDDALAWQAVAIHGDLLRFFPLKVAFFLFAGLALPMLGLSGFPEGAFVAACGFVVVGFAYTVMKPSDALNRELKENTLTTLLMTGKTVTELHDGWLRGTFRFVWPDLALWGLLMGAYALWWPPAVPFVLVGGMILLSSPVLTLLNVLPRSLPGMALLLGIFLVTLLLLAVTIALGTWSPWLVPAISIPIWWFFNQSLRDTLLPEWVAARLERSTE